MTPQQRLLAEHDHEVFLKACPGAGKTRTIINRVVNISEGLPIRKGIAVLSFTNSAVETFVERCHLRNLDFIPKHPNFIGTFDSFIRQFLVSPSGIQGSEARPVIVDSWDTLDVVVKINGSESHKYPVSLDKFNPLDNQIDPTKIGHNGLRNFVTQNRSAYITSAARFRDSLKSKGYLSAADARVIVTQNLGVESWARSLGVALASRFHEIIVDEAQDCNPEDITILRWLRSHGLRVTLVCDPDQAIYEFRHGDPANLQTFSDEYSSTNLLNLTGNFRSSPAICAFSATLRNRIQPDDSLGENSSVQHPVQIIFYSNAVSSAIGQKFIDIVNILEPNTKDAIVLSHGLRSALVASGKTSPEDAGDSNLATLAKSISVYWSKSSTGRDKESCLRNAEKLLLSMMDKLEKNEHPSRAAERHSIDPRELRRKAITLISSVPPVCVDSEDSRTEWLSILHSTVQNMSIQLPIGKSVKNFFPNRTTSKWPHLLQGTDENLCLCSTIHQVKGKEFDAVCVVLPTDRAPDNNTSTLFSHWESRLDHESKRVIYVGATRAKKILTLAIPQSFRDRMRTILRSNTVPFTEFSV